ncbi:hypothetical protein [Microlunatus antarcticus]|uniref:Uncharacterized protein n=2 Tax=Actinomycetes TaxID=1760 RepID=A0A7W5JSJ5_9ACTN|nr:hypothetical protein [Microlunatus antarcticus]MBB3325574.1 hypothetical protein [Microlunatus antarcticus]
MVTPDRLSYARLVKAALVGALLGLVFDVAVTQLTGGSTFSLARLPSIVASGVVGFAGGWLFEVFKAQTEVTDGAVRAVAALERDVARLTRRLGFADQALGMLMDAPRHHAALDELITASMKDKFRSIPDVGVASYLRVLELAIDHAARYEGVHTSGFRWYRDTDAGHYLDGLRDKPMGVKTRLLLVDDADLDAMEADLADDDVMTYYWRHTGDVDTYWMSTGDFRTAFPGRDLPRDCAFYDRQLYVAYDEPKLVLRFDVLDPGNEMARLFDDLRELSARHAPTLHRVARPA